MVKLLNYFNFKNISMCIKLCTVKFGTIYQFQKTILSRRILDTVGFSVTTFFNLESNCVTG